MSPRCVLVGVLALIWIFPTSGLLRLGETTDPTAETYFDLDEMLRGMENDATRLPAIDRRLQGRGSRCRVGQPRVRKEAGDMSDAEWTRYAKAVVALRHSRDGGHLNGYEQFSRVHFKYFDYAHTNLPQSFLPWHRWFVFIFETALRKYDPDVTVPYWNSAIDSEYGVGSPVFTSRRAGGGKNTTATTILGGYFDRWRTKFPVRNVVYRWMDAAVPMANEKEIQNLMTANPCDFSEALQIAHGGPHGYVGGEFRFPPGDMGSVPQSPNDPVFFLHQQKYQDSRPEGMKFCKRIIRFGPETVLKGFNRTIGDALEFDKCVSYLPTKRKGAKLPKSLRLEVESQRRDITIPSELCTLAEMISNPSSRAEALTDVGNIRRIVDASVAPVGSASALPWAEKKCMIIVHAAGFGLGSGAVDDMIRAAHVFNSIQDRN